jgi:large subunit ribosomal protein L18
MAKKKKLNSIRLRRARRTRAKIFGTTEKPRFSVFRSNRYTYVQMIDDKAGKTLVSVSTRGLSKNKKEKKQDSALKLGELVAKKAIEKNVKKAVFDRGKYKYHGRIKAIAEGARQAGLKI